MKILINRMFNHKKKKKLNSHSAIENILFTGLCVPCACMCIFVEVKNILFWLISKPLVKFESITKRHLMFLSSKRVCKFSYIYNISIYRYIEIDTATSVVYIGSYYRYKLGMCMYYLVSSLFPSIGSSGFIVNLSFGNYCCVYANFLVNPRAH